MVASVEGNGAMDTEDTKLDVFARAAQQEHALMNRKEAIQAAIKKCKNLRHNHAKIETVPQNESQAQTELEAGEGEMARYKQYQPKELKIGHAHPDHIVESASLATARPPKIFYKLSSALEEDWKNRTVSNLQLETVIYAMQRYEGPRLPDGARAGFFLGDGAGVGKGRQIAALIKEMWLKGTRRILWLSHCNDLREDARRDMTDCNIHVRSHNIQPAVKSRKQQKVEIDVWPNGNQAVPACPGSTTLAQMFSADGGDGVMFITYNLLRAGLVKVVPARGESTEEYSERVYAALQKKNTRFMKLLEWLKGDRSETGPLIVLDECHKAKNLIPPTGSGKPTTTGLAVHLLQQLLPDAAVMYSSATGISEPNNMAYMVRLGTFGFPCLRELIDNLKEAGLGASELFACSLKKQGIYLARQLAYDGAEFDLAMVDLDHVFQVQYARSAAMWQLLALLVPKAGCWALTHGRVFSLLWADHQRFFKSMLMAAKVPALADEALKAINSNHCVVIGLQSTGEANMQAEKEKGGETMDQIFSAPKVQISRTVGKYMDNKPDPQVTITEGTRMMTEVVSALVCFAEHICGAGAGTAVESAAQLEELVRKDAENRAARMKAEREQKIQERKARALRGETEHESDLEDDDEDLDNREEVHHSLLSCVSLSKLTGDYVEKHKGEETGKALMALVTHTYNSSEAQDWTMAEEHMERILNETYAKLEDEVDRREENERHMKLLADRRHLASRVEAHKNKIQSIQKELAELDNPQNGSGGAAGGGRRRSASAAQAAGANNGAVVDAELQDDEIEEEAPVATAAKRAPVRQQILDSDDDDEGAPAVPGKNATETPTAQKRVAPTLDDFDSDIEIPAPATNGSVDCKRAREGSSQGAAGNAVDAEAVCGGPSSDQEPTLKSVRLSTEVDAGQDAERRAEQECTKILEELPLSEFKELAAAVAPPVDIEMDVCMVCGQEEGDGTFDECSWCHRQVHLACHDPVLPEKPGMQDSWYCSCCKDTVHKRNAARGVIARRTLRSMKNGNTPEAAAPQASNPSAKNGKVQDLEALLAGGTPELTTTALAGSSKRGATSRGTAGASNSKARKSASAMADKKVLKGGSKGPVSAASLMTIAKPTLDGVLEKNKKLKQALYMHCKWRLTGGAAGKSKGSPAGDQGAEPAGQEKDVEPEQDAVQTPPPDNTLRELLSNKRRKNLEKRLDEELRNLDAAQRKLGGVRKAHEQQQWPKDYSQAEAGRKTRSSAGPLMEAGRHFDDDDMPEASEEEEEDDVLDDADDDDPEEVDDLFGVKRKLVNERALTFKDMTRNFSEEEPYDWDKTVTIDHPPPKKPEHYRPDPHPVTVKCKVVLRKLIDLLELPPNPLDLLTHLCGGRHNVAEMTGRTEMMEWMPNGQFATVRRADECSAQQSLNLKERKRFMDGDKLIAIISDAASTGISLQADNRVANKRRRIHLTLELPWSADKSIQQFGRSHRSNQASAPIYKLLMTPAAGEYRFASSAAKRLQSLGAILKGNRQALGAGQNLKEFDVDHSYGAKAVHQFIGELTGRKTPHGQLLKNPNYEGKDDQPRSIWVPALVPPEAGILDHTCLTDMNPKSKHVTTMPKVLNRLLGMNLQQQQIIFGYLQQLIDFEIETAKAKGQYESGVLFLERAVRYVASEVVWQQGQDTTKQISLTTLEHDEGLAYEEAFALMEQNKDQIEKHGSFLAIKDVGFYIRKRPKNQLGTGCDRITLVTGELRNASSGGRHAAKILRRNPWQVSASKEEFSRFKDHWKLCKNEIAAKNLWEFWYRFLENRCQHQHPCPYKAERGHCSHGNRTRRFRVLHGSLLLAWEPILRYHKRNFLDIDDLEEVGDDDDEEEEKAQDPNQSPGKKKPRGRKAGSHRLEMASTSFKDDKGEEQTLTGLVVRHEILQNLINALHEHQGGVAHAAQAGDIAAAQALMNGAQNAAAMAGAIMHELQQNQADQNGPAAVGPNMKWLQEAAGAEKFVPAKAEPALQDIKPKQPISAAPQLCLPDPDLPTVQFKQELFVKEEQGLPSTSAGVRGRRKSLFTSLASTSQQQPEAGVKPEHPPLDD